MTQLHLIAHDIRSRENVGSLFRTCDSLGVARLWLTGYTPAPPDEKIQKVALGAESAVDFVRVVDIDRVFDQFFELGIPVYALEVTDGAVDLDSFHPPKAMGLLLGSERTGVPPTLLRRCAGALRLPQRGIKTSMNVSVAAGIACWELTRRGI